ncbi:MAG: transketolase family protein [Luteitalea sp.]|nr:transketolase family protein [Luteitalea sp.]
MIEAQPNRAMYGQTLVELGEQDPRIIVFEADIAKSTNTYRFGERFPERFFNCGAAELNMVCMAAGASTMGLIPFASTFCMFASMRACEAVRQSVCYAKRNVKIVATNAGVEIAGDGPSHQAVEDLAIMRVMANLIVLSPSDPVTTRLATRAIAAYVGPVYMRLGRQVAPVLHAEETPFEIGTMIRLRDGGDVTIIATGNMVEQALIAADELSRAGVEARVLDCHTIKPIDRQAIVHAAQETGCLVTAEDHSIYGGLGGAVSEVVAETCPVLVHRVGLADRFASSGRDYKALLRHFGLHAGAIVDQVQQALSRRRAYSRDLASPLRSSEWG